MAFAAVLDAQAPLSAPETRALIEAAAAVAPVLLVIDEFGKSIEQFVATGGPEDDLFVLQDVAEWCSRRTENPVALLTLQHLSFEDYAIGASAAKRREWSKVQGRFADMPYVESQAQSQALIGTVFESEVELSRWTGSMTSLVDVTGFADLLHISFERMYPLHPVTAAILPELCSRYGQNERTLFSFLAGPDSSAVPAFLRNHSLSEAGLLPSVRLSDVYDFFLESAATMTSSSSSASRWLEIETRIRDIAGLGEAEQRVLKSVAVLNLVSAGGVLRASKRMVTASVLDEGRGTSTDAEVASILASLESRGVLTYRTFADEFRVWDGSDFDIKGAVELARRRLSGATSAAVLQRVRPPRPVVAARHSQRTGILRVFERRFVDNTSLPQFEVGRQYDGAVLLHLGPSDGFPDVRAVGDLRPVVLCAAPDTAALADCAREVAAHIDVLDGPDGASADWVARRELGERAAAAAAALDTAIEETFGGQAKGLLWTVLGEESSSARSLDGRSLSAELSDLCDGKYPAAPIVRNEMLSRRDLTSQGARARRNLLEAMISAPALPRCGIEGYGPERAMYEAVLARTGIHRFRDGILGLGDPLDGVDGKDSLNFGPTWAAIDRIFSMSEGAPISVDEVYRQLAAPPIGLKEGPIPVLLTSALLARADDVALYENGSFVARLAPPVIERLTRNPELFSIKSHAIRGARADIVQRLAATLEVVSRQPRGLQPSSIVGVVGRLLGRVRVLPAYTQRTKHLSESTISIRTALLSATEPDGLLFDALPRALGLPPVPPTGSVDEADVDAFIASLSDALDELERCFAGLLSQIEANLRAQLLVRGDDMRVSIAGRVSSLGDTLLDTDLKAFVLALGDRALDRSEWLEYVAMVVAAKPPASWTDLDRRRFEIRLAELAAALRRMEGIYYDRSRPVGDGFEAVRISVTTPDGQDTHRVVWVDATVRSDLDRLAASTLKRVEALLGPAGREMLLATVAMDVLGTRVLANPTVQTDVHTKRRASGDE